MENTITNDIKDIIPISRLKSFKDYIVGDKGIWGILLILCAISLVFVYSSSSMIIFTGGENRSGSVLLKQFVLLIIGLGITVLVSNFVVRFKPGILQKFSFFLYGMAIVLLAMTFSNAFSSEINGANRWVNIFGFSIQPSEFAKMVLIITIARIIANHENELENKNKVLFPILILSGIVILIVLYSNFSTAVFIGFIMLFMLFLGRLPFKQIFAVLGVVATLGVIMGLVIIKKPEIFPRGLTWQKRIVSFVPSIAPYASGYNAETDYAPIDNYQVTQAKIAIANGGLTGKMPGNSDQRNKLSQAYCDFIYAIIIEETGILGAILIVFLFLILAFRALAITKRCFFYFDTLVVLGLTFSMCVQAFIHMGVVVNLLPATGQTLPIISSGGSSLFITCIEFGIILGISEYSYQKTEKEKNLKKEEA